MAKINLKILYMSPTVNPFTTAELIAVIWLKKYIINLKLKHRTASISLD